MVKYASIKIKATTKKAADRLIKKYETSGIEFYDSMVKYFDTTGVNPKDQKVLSPAEELKKFRDTIISFMRKQEKDFILPVFGKMDLVMGRFLDYLDNEAPKEMVKKPLELEEGQDAQTGKKDSNPEQDSIELLKVKGELSQHKMRNEKLKIGVIEIFNKSDFKSTGLTKKIVIDMPQYEFEEIKNLIGRM